MGWASGDRHRTPLGQRLRISRTGLHSPIGTLRAAIFACQHVVLERKATLPSAAQRSTPRFNNNVPALNRSGAEVVIIVFDLQPTQERVVLLLLWYETRQPGASRTTEGELYVRIHIALAVVVADWNSLKRTRWIDTGGKRDYPSGVSDDVESKPRFVLTDTDRAHPWVAFKNDLGGIIQQVPRAFQRSSHWNPPFSLTFMRWRAGQSGRQSRL